MIYLPLTAGGAVSLGVLSSSECKETPKQPASSRATTKTKDPVNLQGKSAQEAEQMLIQIWEHNNRVMVDSKTGRPYADIDGRYKYQDPDIDGDGNIMEYLTFSEAVGYKLFTEVVMGIHARKSKNKALEQRCRHNFEKVWNWAFENLVRKNIKKIYDYEQKSWVSVPEAKRDNLMAWRYIEDINGTGKNGIIYYKRGRESDGRWIDGIDAAPDGDQFTAVALFMASKLWATRPQKHAYLESAKKITRDMRAKYIRNIGGKNYLLGGDEYHAVNGINPSYSFEAAYENIFPQLDPEGAGTWRSLIKTSYDVAVKGADTTLKTSLGNPVRGKTNLPPSWISVGDNHTFTDMPWFNETDWTCGWDGMRTLAMKAWHRRTNSKSVDAIKYLTDKTGTPQDFGPFVFLKNEFRASGRLNVGYGINGTRSHKDILQEAANFENPFGYGIYLAYFSSAGDKTMTEAMFRKLKAFYVGDLNGNGTIEDYEGTFWSDKNEFLVAKRLYQNKLDENGVPTTDNKLIYGPVREADGKLVGHKGRVIIDKISYFGSYWAWFGLATASGWIDSEF